MGDLLEADFGTTSPLPARKAPMGSRDRLRITAGLPVKLDSGPARHIRQSVVYR